MRHLSVYILRAHVGPFFFSVGTLMFLFLLQFVMKFIDQLVGKGLTAWVILELVALNLSWMLVLAVPMSVLVATLMAFGDLSSKNEITAMKATGVSLYRMMLPALVAAVVLSVLLVLFNNYVLPESNHRLKALTIDIRRKRPTLTLVNGVFSQDIPGYSILVKRTYPRSNELAGVTLYDFTNPNTNVVITADHGRISFSPDFRKIIMDLDDGEIHELNMQHLTAYRKVRFQRHRIAMDVEGFDFERSAESAFSRGDREMSAHEMRIIVDSLQRTAASLQADLEEMMTSRVDHALAGAADTIPMPPSMLPPHPAAAALTQLRGTQTSVSTFLFRLESVKRETDQYLVEIYKKYSIPAACIVFILVGVPLGIRSRRGGFGMAATLSLGFFVIYWACLIGGEKLADRAILSPFWGMWSANIIIGAVGIYLTVRAARETTTLSFEWLYRLVPRRWRPKTELPAAI